MLGFHPAHSVRRVEALSMTCHEIDLHVWCAHARFIRRPEASLQVKMAQSGNITCLPRPAPKCSSAARRTMPWSAEMAKTSG